MTVLAFHDVRFPTDIALGASGGPERRTEVITLGSGAEQRNARWMHSRRKYNIGYGIKSSGDLYKVLEFFEERRGRLYGFRFRDPMDFRSSEDGNPIGPLDQQIGTGDGVQTRFRLSKHYGSGETSYSRPIKRPDEQSIQVAVDGVLIAETEFQFDFETGEIVINSSSIPTSGATVSAGYEFDVPVRFDTDEITVNLAHFEAGNIPSIPLVELL